METNAKMPDKQVSMLPYLYHNMKGVLLWFALSSENISPNLPTNENFPRLRRECFSSKIVISRYKKVPVCAEIEYFKQAFPECGEIEYFNKYFVWRDQKFDPRISWY